MSERAKTLLHIAHSGRFYLPPSDREGAIAAYDQCLKYIDNQTGELLRFLEHSPEWSNTYVIIASDHGEAFGEHDTYGHGWNLYGEVLRVPLIVVGPGIPAGLRVDHIARTRQLFSTALDLAGVKGAVLRRTSLVRYWQPNYAPNTPDEPTVSELLDNVSLPAPWGLTSLTTRDWHLIRRAGQGRDLLFNWPKDPFEQRNVADLPENQVVMERLKANLTSIIERSYRPWRDLRYLLALSGPEFSPELEAKRLLPRSPGGPLLAQGAGAAQTLFPQNPETPLSAKNRSEEELLRSIPYDGAP